MRIAITGSHSLGKSTVVNDWVAARDGYIREEEPYRALGLFGPYEILSSLGAGGMGEVYKAKDSRLDRFVAIKVLPEHLTESPDALARFEREAKAISSLQHPNICTLYDVGREGEVDFLVMELLDGESLAAVLHEADVAARRALALDPRNADATAALLVMRPVVGRWATLDAATNRALAPPLRHA